MRCIEVVAAIIRRDNKILATQRGYGKMKGWWEFPGGKIVVGETVHQALKREICEELDAEIEIGNLLRTIEWDYPDFHLTMHCYWCELVSDTLHLNEHDSARWLGDNELHSVRWLPADVALLAEIADNLTRSTR